MKTRKFAVSFVVALVFDSVASGQPPDTYVSGLLHHPLGGITDFTVDGRSLTACCLGSSGEDGVEVRFDSLYGGGVSVDLTPMLGATGVQREIRCRPKGWDGTVKGTLRLSSDADGVLTELYDFSTTGASSLEWRVLDEQGGVLAEGVEPGSVLAWGLEVTPAPGQTARKEYRMQASVAGFSAKEGFFDAAVTVTGLTSSPITGVQAIEVTPDPCAGCPNDPWTDLQSIELTGDGMSDLVLADAHLATFEVESWGLGQAHLSEECIGFPPPCAKAERGLQVADLGSNGLDGVAFDTGSNAGGVSAAVGKEKCCRGHVIIMKLYDDEGQEQRISRTQIDELNPDEELDADFSSLGASGYRLTLFDALGAVVGPAGGTEILAGGPKPYFTNNCPDGQAEWWVNQGTPSNPLWVFHGCTSGYDFVLPGYGSVPNVDSYRIEPLDATSSVGRLTQCVVTSDDPDGFVVENVVVASVAKGDLNWDGVVNNADFNVFADCIAGPDVTSPPAGCDAGAFSRADLDTDDDVDLADFADFQEAFTGD
jgi:hypothetical protein